MKKLNKIITSLEVAEMVERRHDQVMRDINNIISHLGDDHKSVGNYFTKDEYKDGLNRNKPCYLLTKKGCELYSTRMTGGKGTKFAVAYIERFNEMENHIKEEQPKNNTRLLLETALKHEERMESIESDVNLLKETMRITNQQEHKLWSNANKTVVNALGGKQSPAYRYMNRKVFSRFWSEFKRYFEVSTYKGIPKKDFEKAICFIKYWNPDTTTRMEINESNNQMTIDDERGA